MTQQGPNLRLFPQFVNILSSLFLVTFRNLTIQDQTQTIQVFTTLIQHCYYLYCHFRGGIILTHYPM